MGKYQPCKALNYTVAGPNLHIRYSVGQLLYTLQSDLTAKQWGVTFVEVSVRSDYVSFGSIPYEKFNILALYFPFFIFRPQAVVRFSKK